MHWRARLVILAIYAVGVGLAVVGALGLVDGVSMSTPLAVTGFLAGLGLVILVHERLGGPL